MYDFNDMINRIKAIKKQKKLSNETLATLSHVPKGTLAKILGSETKDPQISTIIKIAEALEVSADYIIFGKNENSKKSKFETLFYSLNSVGQNKVIEYIQDLHNSGTYSKEHLTDKQAEDCQKDNFSEKIAKDVVKCIESGVNIPTIQPTNTK